MAEGNKLVVVFTKNNARILKNPQGETDYLQFPNAVVNPDLSMVTHVPPHFWKLEHGQVKELTDYEKTQRLDDIARHGVDNEVRPQKIDWVFKKSRNHKEIMDKLAYSFAGAFVMLILVLIVKSWMNGR